MHPPLVVDRASTAVALDGDEVRAWAADERAFISSVMADLRAERQSVADAVAALGAEPVWFERFGGRDDDPEQAYLTEVASSDIYLGILGRRYGRLLPSRRSATHEEYREAEREGLRLSVWVSEGEREGDQQTFLEEVRTFHTTGSYSSAVDLGERVRERLRRIAAQDLAPWCKLDHVVFRAARIVHSGNGVEITGTVKADEVVHELEALRPGWLPGGQGRRLTYANTSALFAVRDVEVTTVTGRTRSVRLSLEAPRRQDSTFGSLTEMSLRAGTSTYSPDDLTEIAVSGALFGEPNPLGISASLAEIPNPLPLVADLRLSEDTIGPILRLLLVETLVGSGRAARISRFRLGQRIDGQRRLVLEWEAPRRHADRAPERRCVEGTIPF